MSEEWKVGEVVKRTSAIRCVIAHENRLFLLNHDSSQQGLLSNGREIVFQLDDNQKIIEWRPRVLHG
jgi:hypothetical protein